MHMNVSVYEYLVNQIMYLYRVNCKFTESFEKSKMKIVTFLYSSTFLRVFTIHIALWKKEIFFSEIQQ